MEGWAPEYGASLEPDADLAPAEGSVDIDVEGRPWEPVDGFDDGVPKVAFVDGVRRVDARLLLESDAGPVPGLCGSFGAGAVVWDRDDTRSEVTDVVIDRVAILTGGHAPNLPPVGPQLTYRSISVPDDDPAQLIRRFHDGMRRAEAEIAEELANRGLFVVADGPLYDYTDSPKVGYVKSHRRTYLPPEQAGVIGLLERGQRTPLFTIGEHRFRRYSWYQRLDAQGAGHSWHGVVRCEASGSLDRASVVALADRTAAVLPACGSVAHIDPRAPQNLFPIGALERELRRRLGDPGLVLRAIRAAARRAA